MDRSTKRQLYARHGMPFLWLVDPEARMLEALALGPEGYALALRASGPEPLARERLALLPAGSTKLQLAPLD